MSRVRKAARSWRFDVENVRAGIGKILTFSAIHTYTQNHSAAIVLRCPFFKVAFGCISPTPNCSSASETRFHLSYQTISDAGSSIDHQVKQNIPHETFATV
jgi:hypothetical protein